MAGFTFMVGITFVVVLHLRLVITTTTTTTTTIIIIIIIIITIISLQFALPVLAYLMRTQKWPIADLKQLDRETRKILVENGGKHPLGSKALYYLHGYTSTASNQEQNQK